MSSQKSSKCSSLIATSKKLTTRTSLEIISGCIIKSKSPHLSAGGVHGRPGTGQKCLCSGSVAMFALVTL